MDLVTLCEDLDIVELIGLPVAALMSHREYEKLTRQQALATFEQLSRDLGLEAERGGLSEADFPEGIQAARRDFYEERHSRRAG